MTRTGFERIRRAAPSLLALACCVPAAFSCASGESKSATGNLLHGLRPRVASGVRHAERLTDGVAPAEGDGWLSDLTAVYSGPTARVVYDLGRSMPIVAALVVGDNNDRFTLAGSDDGKRFEDIWRVPAVEGAGMRLRKSQGFGARARYVQLTAQGGDAFVSAGELMIFAAQPASWPPALERRFGKTPLEGALALGLALGAALALLALSALRRAPRYAAVFAAACSAFVAALYAARVVDLWPPPIELSEQLRALLAAVALCALLVLGAEGARKRLVHGLLLALGLLGVVCFYNFGAPWFWNAEARRLTPVHTYDMRVYFPVAKYFDELRFDGVYFASVKAYAEGEHVPLAQLAHVELRDLRTNLIVRAERVQAQIDGVKQRFSPARWDEFVADMRFFWRTMGTREYLGSLEDHGGNATPVWIALAHLLFSHTRASERALTLTGLLDPLLLLLTFVCVKRSFGLRAMLICLVVFGTTDFPMFGSDWAGSTLRFDWMATLGLGACALRTRRYALGGALLAHAGLVRAFPVLALAFAPLPFVLQALERRLGRRVGREPAAESAGVGVVRTLAGAAVTTAALVGLSCALFGFERAWLAWVHKIELHTEDANTNHLGVRTVMAFDPSYASPELEHSGVRDPWHVWQETQLETYRARSPVAFALRALFALLCVLSCRKARPEQAALIGLILIPVLTYPANYYCHYVFLLPLLAVDQGRGVRLWIEGVLLAMCVLEYFTLPNAVDLRFFWEAVILLTGLLAILIPLARAGLVPVERELQLARAAA